MGLKSRLIYPLVRQLSWWQKEVERLNSAPPQADVDNTYAYLRYGFHTLMQDEVSARKPFYAWGTLQAAALAHALKVPKISVLEFGVAGGNGLIALERISLLVERMTGVGIEVYGFDSGRGLPKPEDYRDQPNMWFEGQLPMKEDELKAKLTRAKLRIGWVNETVHGFVNQNNPPVGFVSFDLDLWSSTAQAFEVLKTEHSRVLPRVACYFDDIFGHSYSEYTGERLAINEFNELDRKRKLDPIHGLRHFVPPAYRDLMWETMYFAHYFKHPLYNALDSARKAVYTDDVGNDVRANPESDWKERVLR
jgi:hypothetical protein